MRIKMLSTLLCASCFFSTRFAVIPISKVCFEWLFFFTPSAVGYIITSKFNAIKCSCHIWHYFSSNELNLPGWVAVAFLLNFLSSLTLIRIMQFKSFNIEWISMISKVIILFRDFLKQRLRFHKHSYLVYHILVRILRLVLSWRCICQSYLHSTFNPQVKSIRLLFRWHAPHRSTYSINPTVVVFVYIDR